MKAWLARKKDEFCATIVFAETRGKAKALALHTETCEDADFIHIEVHRVKEADKYYKPGTAELYWFDAEDSQYYNDGESWDIYQPDEFCSRGERRNT